MENEFSNGQNKMGKNIAFSILWGIRSGFIGFVIGTIVVALLIIIWAIVEVGHLGDSYGMLMFFVSPIVGVVVGVLSAVVGGIRRYKKLST